MKPRRPRLLVLLVLVVVVVLVGPCDVVYPHLLYGRGADVVDDHQAPGPEPLEAATEQ